MIKQLVNIRFKQLFRNINGIGLIRILVLLILCVYVGLIVIKYNSKYPDSIYFTCGIVLLLLFLQVNRKDKLFLKIHFEKHKYTLLVEYLIFTSPFLLLLLLKLQLISAIILILSITIIINIDYKIKRANLNTPFQKIIPDDCFEWKAGVRQSLFVILPVWACGLFFSFTQGAVPVALFVIGIIPFSFYEKGEPYQLIISTEISSSRFILLKIKRLLLLYSFLAFPLICLYIIFNISLWYIPVIEYFVFLSLYFYVIVTKYAFYEPNKKLGTAMTYGSIGIISGVVVILLPLVWALSIRFYFRAKNNLNFYLNDFN